MDQITFKPPKAVPVNVPFSQEIKATAKVQQPLTLTVASQDYEVKPGDFSSSKSGTGEAQSVTNYTASVGDIKVPETSSFDMSLTQGDETVAEASARAIWG
ncbi:MAG: hypothetical protein M3N10_05040 [Actinomycetota bacterium]|nr:hypothetical protein [Actinomycetota bacterium]HZY66840.1 hypothetical protein [Rubrobacteraceae bacterium]